MWRTSAGQHGQLGPGRARPCPRSWRGRRNKSLSLSWTCQQRRSLPQSMSSMRVLLQRALAMRFCCRLNALPSAPKCHPRLPALACAVELHRTQCDLRLCGGAAGCIFAFLCMRFVFMLVPSWTLTWYWTCAGRVQADKGVRHTPLSVQSASLRGLFCLQHIWSPMTSEGRFLSSGGLAFCRRSTGSPTTRTGSSG